VRAQVREVWHKIEDECGAYLRSEVLQGLAAGLLLYIGGRLVGHPYPMLLALIAAVAWLLPWIGGIITLIAVVALWIPQSILDAGTSLWMSAGPMALYTVVVLSFLEYFVEPKLFDRRRYNALLVILVTVGLADFMGMLGFLLGPPLAASLQIVGRHLFVKRPASIPEPLKTDLPLVDKLEQLQRKLSQEPETPSNLVSLVARLGSLLKAAERAPETQSIPIAAGTSGDSTGQ
jgi:predicted PurR-regulated permease PerM